MTTPPNTSAKSIFLNAAERPAGAEREAYLADACGSDSDLRRDVDDLLAHLQPAGAFLERPEARPTVDAPRPAAATGEVIADRYKLLERVGEGGMGEVWLAEQTEPVRRKVAVKLVKAGLDSRQVVARFEAERQALALMDHPNIARVLDGGVTEAGRPYFVMELVKGTPITKYCDDHTLPVRDRLALFADVCRAVQHAHQKGVIHRDLKPSNVLVAPYDGRPVVKVIDFGVAKAAGAPLTEKTLFTGLGAVVGTPEYMSPEQAELNNADIDTRSDVYSLGVLLYELLTGTTPLTRKRLKEAALFEVLRLVREEEPARPSTRLSTTGELPSIAASRGLEPKKLSGLVRGELDWIVMKALEKDRNRRYETANGFAMDVQRYLADEPVQACPPSAGYRLRKLARRNKAALATAGLVLFFIVLLGGVVGWGMRDRTAREQEIALDKSKKLALTEEGIRQALDRGTTSRAELHTILKKAGGVQELLNQPARWELFLKTAQGELAQARRLADRAEGGLGAEYTQGMHQLEQQLTSDQADYDLALRLERISLDTVAREIVRFSRPNTIAEYEAALAPFGVLGDDPAVVAVRLAASPIREQLVAALDECAMSIHVSHKDLAERLLTLARQTAPDPVWGDRVRQLAVWDDRQALEKLATEAPAARLSPRLACMIGDGLRIKGSDDLSVICLRRAQAQYPADFWLNFNLGHALSRTNPAEAVGFYRAALAIRPGTSAVYNNLGADLADQKRFAEAVDAYHKAIELDPKNAGKPYVNLGGALYQQGKVADAIKAFNKAIEIDSKSVYAYVEIGKLYRDQRRWQESIQAYRNAIKINPKKATTHNSLGLTLFGQGNFKEAADAYRTAIAIDRNYADAYCNLGLALQRQGKPGDAIAACGEAIRINPKHANAHNIRGVTLEAQGKVDEAIIDYRKAIELDRRFVGAYGNLGSALWRQGEYQGAITRFRNAIDLDSQAVFPRVRLALLLITSPDPKFRDPREAVEHAKKAVELHPPDVLAWQVLGWAQYRAGDWRKSIEALEKSCKLQPGGTGDHSQWIVLALAHARLAEQPGLPEKARETHKVEARHWYEQADKSINSKWRVRPGFHVGDLGQDIWDFREEARALMHAKVDKE